MKHLTIKNILLFISIFFVQKLSYGVDNIDEEFLLSESFVQALGEAPIEQSHWSLLSDPALLQDALVKSITSNNSQNKDYYTEIYKRAQKKCSAIADKIYYSGMPDSESPEWIKMLLFAIIATDIDDDNIRNPLIYPAYFNHQFGELIKEIFKILKIDLTILNKSQTPPNSNIKTIAKINLSINCKLYIDSSLGYKVYIQSDQRQVNDQIFILSKEKLLTMGTSILTALNPNIDTTITRAFADSLEARIKHNETLNEQSLMARINIYDLLMQSTPTISNQEAQNVSQISSDLKLHIDTQQSESYSYILENTSARHKYLAKLINERGIDEKLKTLLLATLTLGDENTNPLLNPACLNSELGKLIQCALRCFGVRILETSVSPENVELIFLSRYKESGYSLHYSKDAQKNFSLILFSQNPSQPDPTNQKEAFIIDDRDLFNYVLNTYRCLMLTSFDASKTQKPLTLKEDINLAYQSEEVWDALVTTQKNDRYNQLFSSDKLLNNFYEINQHSFKNIFLDEFSRVFLADQLFADADNINHEMTTIIQNAELSDTQKAFIYWLITLDFSNLKMPKKGTNLGNPLQSKKTFQKSAVPLLYGALLDFISLNQDSILVPIVDSFPKLQNGKKGPFKKNDDDTYFSAFSTLLTEANFCKDLLSYGKCPLTSEKLLKRFDAGPQTLLNFIIDQLNYKFINIKIYHINNKLIIKQASSIFITYFKYPSKEIRLKENKQKELIKNKNKCLKKWMELIDLSKYDRALNKARKVFQPTDTDANDAPPPAKRRKINTIDAPEINTDILKLIDEIEALPEVIMSKTQKMILYIIMPVKSKWGKKNLDTPFCSFFRGYWTRYDQDGPIDSCAVIHLLNLHPSVMDLLSKYIKKRSKKNLVLGWISAGRAKSEVSFAKYCEQSFAETFFQSGHVNDVLKKVKKYFRYKIIDPRKI